MYLEHEYIISGVSGYTHTHKFSDLLGTRDALKLHDIDPTYRVKLTDSWASSAVAGHDRCLSTSSLFVSFAFVF